MCVKNLDAEVLLQALTYINPLIVYNDTGYPGMWDNKTIKSGKLRTIGQLIDYLTKQRPMSDWEMRQFIQELPTFLRYRQMRSEGIEVQLINEIRADIQRRGISSGHDLRSVTNGDFVYNFNLSLN